MKTIIMLAVFTTQIFSHILFMNDPNNLPGSNTVSTNKSTEMITANNTNGVSSGLSSTWFSNTEIRKTVLEQTSSTIPGGYYLGQRSPNLFEPLTSIYFSLPWQQHVRVVIMDMLGQTVKIILNDVIEPGTYKMSMGGTGLSSGVYVYRFETDNFSELRKIILIQ